jgi:hypothetical protein
MTLVKFEPWHQYLQNIPMKTEVKCYGTQQSLTNYMETFKEEEHIWQDEEDVGKGYRIIYCINPESHKRVVGAITACNTANVYTYLLIWKALIFLHAYTYWEWQVYKTS